MPSSQTGKYVLLGRIVTMDAHATVVKRGALYIDASRIVAVQDESDEAPSGFVDAPTLRTKGTLYPGLIELHNHLSYNALRLWNVPKQYENRDDWPKHPEYRQLVTGPMGVLGKSKRPELLAALVRYVETKCLIAGVTTSQGVKLASNAGVTTFYKGVVRNVEQPGDKKLKAAKTHIADVQAKEWLKFKAAISGPSSMILHLSEGTDTRAREHFLALKNTDGEWAITDKLIGIHCVALTQKDFTVLAKHGGSMVWSPLSNFLLYGDTAKVDLARKAGVVVALGSDWSPSGSKNLLGELKVARLVADKRKWQISDQEIIAMATTNPAKMLQWDAHLGSLEAGKLADVLVVDGDTKDPYDTLIRAREDGLSLIVIGGVPRYGKKASLDKLGVASTKIKLHGRTRAVSYLDEIANPKIANLTLEEARKTLTKFFGNLPKEAKAIAAQPAVERKGALHLVLDEQEPDGEQARPMLKYRGRRTGFEPVVSQAAQELPLIKLELDSLSAIEDTKFRDVLAEEKNLPSWLKKGMKGMF